MSQRWVARAVERRHSGAVPDDSLSAGAELFSLCHTAAPDGTLTPREHERLRAWLDRVEAVDVPARAFVRGLIEHILAHRRVSPADLQALGRALEPSLPAVLRRKPASSLRLVGSNRMPYSDENATERVRNEVVASACFMVAGCETERLSIVPRAVRAGDPVLFVREQREQSLPRGQSPQRGQGPAAESSIQVRTPSGKALGFVPAHRAAELAPLLERGARYRAHLIIVSSGVHAPVLIVQAFFYRRDAALGLFHAGSRRIAPRPSARGWMAVRIAIALAIAAAVALVLRT